MRRTVRLNTAILLFVGACSASNDSGDGPADSSAGSTSSTVMTEGEGEVESGSGDMTQGDMTQGDMTQGDMTQGDMTQGDMTQGGDSTGTGDSTCPADLPEPSDPCLEGCGNSLGVGRPCSPGGGECVSDDFNNATLCVVDFVPNASLAQCTKPCVANDQCGEDAFCQGDPDDPAGPKGCVPIACDPEGFEMSEEE